PPGPRRPRGQAAALRVGNGPDPRAEGRTAARAEAARRGASRLVELGERQRREAAERVEVGLQVAPAAEKVGGIAVAHRHQSRSLEAPGRCPDFEGRGACPTIATAVRSREAWP